MITILTIMTLMLLLMVKHWIIDFYWQPPYEWQNKGTYGHFGGIRHAGKHVFGSFFILIFFVNPIAAFLICMGEFIIHYHMDWFKMWWNKKKEYTPQTEKFWHWVGNDQFVHYLTYWGICLIISLL